MLLAWGALACACCACASQTSGTHAKSASAHVGGKAQDVSSFVEDQLHATRMTQDFREEFVHGDKGAEYQRYIVLHDTESEGDATAIVNWWDEANSGVAAHFIVNRDGSIVQCVPLDKIAHHAGYGDTGHNELFDVTDETRDDKVGSTPIGDHMADYGMNSYSVGIEIAHAASDDGYPEAQLAALDWLIGYVNDHYGFASEIIDHKAWRSGNSDTSAAFEEYLGNYQAHGTHD